VAPVADSRGFVGAFYAGAILLCTIFAGAIVLVQFCWCNFAGTMCWCIIAGVLLLVHFLLVRGRPLAMCRILLVSCVAGHCWCDLLGARELAVAFISSTKDTYLLGIIAA